MAAQLNMQTALMWAFCLAWLAVVSCEAINGRGFGDQYQWKSMKEGLPLVKAGKPGMLVIHKSWCGACKTLGK